MTAALIVLSLANASCSTNLNIIEDGKGALFDAVRGVDLRNGIKLTQRGVARIARRPLGVAIGGLLMQWRHPLNRRTPMTLRWMKGSSLRATKAEADRIDAARLTLDSVIGESNPSKLIRILPQTMIVMHAKGQSTH